MPLTRGEGLDLEAKVEHAIIHYNYQTISQYIDRLNRYTNIQAKELYLNGYKFDWKDLISKPSHEFLSRFFQSRGYKDGWHGLALSLLQSASMLVLYAKVWELEGFTEGKIDLVEVKKELNERGRQENYWSVEEKLQTDAPILSKLKLKLERKLTSS